MKTSSRASFPARRPGLTLAELIIAGALFGAVFITAVSLQGYVMRNHLRAWRSYKVMDMSVYSLKAIRRSITGASYVAMPEKAGDSSPLLLGYANVNPEDKTSRLSPDKPQASFLYCFSADEGKLYFYSGDFPLAKSFVSFECGKPYAPFARFEVLVDAAAGGAKMEWLFEKPADAGNLVLTRYLVNSGGETLSGATAAQYQGSL
jgi:hypothetical protein